MHKLVAMLRVKDGMLFISCWLDSIRALVDEIVVVDNGSTDGTLEILRSHPKVMSIAQTREFDEARDKNLGYALARARKADWIVWLDVDEFFEERLTRHRLDDMMNAKFINKYAFRRINFHSDERHFEAAFDKLLYQSMPCRLIWRDQPTGHFSERKIHNGSVEGLRGITWPTNIRLKHFGSLHRQHLERKIELYISLDAENRTAYEEVRDQKVKAWRWYEFEEKPTLVTMQNVLWACLTFLRYSQILFKRMIGKSVYLKE